MATPSKSNKNTTPLSVVPGVPHWAYENKHGQRNHGQGYDYHDPTGLQKADGSGGYGVGNAITMFGVVGFRPDQELVSTEHGNIIDIYLTRRFGTQGAYDFYIYYDPDRSTGIPGDFRTDVEHGFDVCRCDIDLGTLNPSVSTVSTGQWRIRFEHGESLKRLRAIVPYRTTVRTLDPVPLVDTYTYFVRERYTALAGHTQDATPLETSQEGQRFSSLSQANLEEMWDTFSNKDVSNIKDFMNNRVEQSIATYQVQTLPLPRSFVKPKIGVPEAEDWKNQFNIWDRILTYTIGRTFSCVIYYRMYAADGFDHTGGGMHPRTKYGHTDYGGRFRKTIYMVFDPDDTNNFTRQPDGYTYKDYGLGDNGWWLAGSDTTWLNQVDLVYASNGELKPYSGYESIRYVDHDDAVGQTNPFALDYTDYTNAQAGEFKNLPKIDHIKLDDSSYNVIFNDVGTDINELYNATMTIAVTGNIPAGETIRDTWSGKRTMYGSVSYGKYLSTGNYKVMGPLIENHPLYSYGKSRLEPGKPYSPTYFYANNHWNRDKLQRERGILYSLTNWIGGNGAGHGFAPNTDSAEAEHEFEHDSSIINDIGLGEGGTSTIVYNVSTMVTPKSEYIKNNILKGYYKCCIDHLDRKVQLVLAKVNEDDPVGYDEITESQLLISKKPVYNVKQHSLYDSNAQEDHAMDPAGTFAGYQSWGDILPTSKPVVEQLFTDEGADPASQVQFLSLSAGALAGGSNPSNRIPKPSPTPGAKLTVVPSNLVRDLVKRDTSTVFNRRFRNDGSNEIQVFLNNIGNGFVSTTNTPYVTGFTSSGSLTAAGDKIDDWSWAIAGANGTGSYRQVGSETASFKLSANEYVDVVYETTGRSKHTGYEVEHTYEAKFPSPIGTKYDKIVFEVEFM